MALGYIFGATQGAARETKVEFRGVPENFEKKKHVVPVLPVTVP